MFEPKSEEILRKRRNMYCDISLETSQFCVFIYSFTSPLFPLFGMNKGTFYAILFYMQTILEVVVWGFGFSGPVLHL